MRRLKNKVLMFRKYFKILIPKKIKKFLRESFFKILSFSVLNFKILRDYYVWSSIKNFNQNQKYIVNQDFPKWTIGAFWDSDGRFKWLKNNCEKNNINMIHIPRVLYRHVFNYLFYSQGYMQDWTKGELPVTIFYEKRFYKKREIYLKYCNQIAKSISSQFDVDLFLLFKLNDDWIIDVIKGIRGANFPVVVHDREHGISPKRMEKYPPYLECIKEDLEVEKICLSNKTHYEFFNRCGFDKDNLALTGKPDTDAWFIKDPNILKKESLDMVNPELPLLTYFSFSKFNYLNFFYDGENRDWLNLADDYHKIFIDVLKKFDGKFQIIYKLGGKPIRDTYPGFESFMEELKELNLQDSIILLDGRVSTIDLLKVSDCIVGFHTLGIVEAMFTDKPIFYGAWGELFDDIKETLIPFHEMKGLNFCHNPQILKQSLVQFFNDKKIGNCDRKIRDREIENYFYKADGKSSERLFNVLEEVYSNFYK